MVARTASPKPWLAARLWWFALALGTRKSTQRRPCLKGTDATTAAGAYRQQVREAVQRVLSEESFSRAAAEQAKQLSEGGLQKAMALVLETARTQFGLLRGWQGA
mmetsp:Transcript_31463/g.59063  ORF Transcript_31463/g.59063 Transcript_31463/m.59063 type:complete len:105 (-) Transcript_31463:193-507(-)